MAGEGGGLVGIVFERSNGRRRGGRRGRAVASFDSSWMRETDTDPLTRTFGGVGLSHDALPVRNGVGDSDTQAFLLFAVC